MSLTRLANRAKREFTSWRVPEISRSRAEKRAADGAMIMDFLDPGWYACVDIEKLDLCDCRHCILGQIYGSFQEGLRRNAVLAPGRTCKSAISPVSLGLIVHQDVDESLQEQDCEFLIQAWLNEIERRRARRERRTARGSEHAHA